MTIDLHNPSPDVIEHVAAALHDVYGSDVPYEHMPEDIKEHWRSLARPAIAALAGMMPPVAEVAVVFL
ncbi:MAG TPA: hypothetical protein VNJ04_19660 [Gemmatimonadaceae bacterium]|nr:hypothetical protein [Gemmatimonadaceae bacterium]